MEYHEQHGKEVANERRYGRETTAEWEELYIQSTFRCSRDETRKEKGPATKRGEKGESGALP